MIDLESLTIEELEDLRDACNRRLLELRRGMQRRSLPELLRLLEEVKHTLRDQGKQWRSLERWQWMDGEIRFWLNPVDQVNYRLGWYTIDELIAWAGEHGPVLAIDDTDLEIDEEPWTPGGGLPVTWLPGGSPGDGDGSANTEVV